MVLVRTRKGREINYSIEQFEDIEDEDVGGTTIWLKQGMIFNEKGNVKQHCYIYQRTY